MHLNTAPSVAKRAKLRDFTVAAIYRDNLQRYGTDAGGRTPEAAMRFVERDRKPDGGVYVCGIFDGDHECVDTNASSATVPPSRRSRPRKVGPYTVVGMTRYGVVFTRHVTARSPELAEEVSVDYDLELVAGVFNGHLANLVTVARHDAFITDSKLGRMY